MLVGQEKKLGFWFVSIGELRWAVKHAVGWAVFVPADFRYNCVPNRGRLRNYDCVCGGSPIGGRGTSCEAGAGDESGSPGRYGRRTLWVVWIWMGGCDV